MFERRKTVYTKLGYYINTWIEIRNLWKIPFQGYSSDEQSSAGDEASGVESDDEETTIWDDLTLEAWTPDTEKTFCDKRAEFVGQGVPSHAAHQDAKIYVLPSLRRNIRKLYMAKIELNKKRRRDGVHKQIMTTKRRLEENENFSADEAMRYAVKKRKYLIQDVTETLSDCEPEQDDDDDIDDHENDDGTVWIPLTGFKSIWVLRSDSCVTLIRHNSCVVVCRFLCIKTK